MRAATARATVLLLAVVVATLLPSGCGRPDGEQVRICRDVVAALDREAAPRETLPAEADPEHPHGVVVRYQQRGVEGGVGVHWVRCRFAGGGFSPGRGELTEVATDRRGTLGEVQLFMLRRFWLGRFETRAEARTGTGAKAEGVAGSAGYALQQAVNALVAGSLYGLLATAYTLVFAIVSRINMAFGETAMVGAYAALLAIHGLSGWTAAAEAGAGILPAVLAAVLAAAALAALLSWAAERTIVRPLRQGPSQPVLIATVGLAIALQETIRLSQGARDRWLQPVLSEPVVLTGADFAVTITTAKVAILCLVALLFTALLLAMHRGRWGRAWRACADDAAMAQLLGVDLGRTVALTFAASGAVTGVAGAIIALHYGGVGFTMGTLLGFKALTAAVVGGIGSLPGAMAGGLLIAAVETLWSAYLPAAGRDVAVFALLAVVLVFRPSGLFALTSPRTASDRSRS